MHSSTTWHFIIFNSAIAGRSCWCECTFQQQTEVLMWNHSSKCWKMCGWEKRQCHWQHTVHRVRFNYTIFISPYFLFQWHVAAKKKEQASCMNNSMYLTKKERTGPVCLFGHVLQPRVAPAVQTVLVSFCKWREHAIPFMEQQCFSGFIWSFFPPQPRLCCPAAAGRRISPAPLPAMLEGAMGFQLGPGQRMGLVNITGDTVGTTENVLDMAGTSTGTWHESQMMLQRISWVLHVVEMRVTWEVVKVHR